MNRLLYITMLSFILVGFNNCVVADVPDEITHNIQISGEDLQFLAGRCFEENVVQEDFLDCLSEDLNAEGFTM